MFVTPKQFIISVTFAFTNFNVIVVCSLLLEEEREELAFILFFETLFVEDFNSADDDVNRLFEVFQLSRFDFNHEMNVSSAFCKQRYELNKIFCSVFLNKNINILS